LRAADLRFMPDEAAAFLNEAMRLRLAPEDVAALEARTEGWIADSNWPPWLCKAHLPRKAVRTLRFHRRFYRQQPLHPRLPAETGL